MSTEFISGINLKVALRGAVCLLQASVILYFDCVSMGFVDPVSIEEIEEFAGFSAHNDTVSLVPRAPFLNGLFSLLCSDISPPRSSSSVSTSNPLKRL
jgi:hypothetical protein